ncbi:hypothetical protein DPMN_028984 [Dreissena polymorpha]|uniref:Uncharacterized protein n=1 Tax=Dreissena polymorpha TaxID=45954 RepID=A0A9D4RGN6_DREPO|nr:hypothetical protein DPMN_028984 [Dreissena polymorpha]
MPSAIERGTTMRSTGDTRGSVRVTTKRLSLEMETSFKYLLTSRTLVCFLDGLVPCLR